MHLIILSCAYNSVIITSGGNTYQNYVVLEQSSREPEMRRLRTRALESWLVVGGSKGPLSETSTLVSFFLVASSRLQWTPRFSQGWHYGKLLLPFSPRVTRTSLVHSDPHYTSHPKASSQSMVPGPSASPSQERLLKNSPL